MKCLTNTVWAVKTQNREKQGAKNWKLVHENCTSLKELLWSAGTHGKALPSNAERRAGRLVQRDGSPYAF